VGIEMMAAQCLREDTYIYYPYFNKRKDKFVEARGWKKVCIGSKFSGWKSIWRASN